MTDRVLDFKLEIGDAELKFYSDGDITINAKYGSEVVISDKIFDIIAQHRTPEKNRVSADAPTVDSESTP